jgi:hypothetical protein
MLVLVAAAGVAWSQEPIDDEVRTDSKTEIVLDLGRDDGGAVQPMVDCSDERPDDDCLSGRLGADQVMQARSGIGPLFGAGSCSTHCQVG